MKVEQSTSTILPNNKINEKQVTESTEEKQDFSKVLDDEIQTLGTSGGGVKRPPN